jgi:hypothetical protein
LTFPQADPAVILIQWQFIGALRHSLVIRSKNDQTLHRLLSSDSLVAESQDALLRVLVELDVNRSDFFGYIEISFLGSEGVALFLSKLQFDDLSEVIWSKVVTRLKGDWLEELRVRRCLPPLDSVILATIPQCLQEFEGKRWTFLFRGSRDGFDSTGNAKGSRTHCR